MICFECGSEAVHQHHVVPKSMGGTKTVPLCAECHGKAHSIAISGPKLTIKALMARKEAGLKYSPVPFGFKEIDGRLVEVESELLVIAEILSHRQAGKTLVQIADELNERGIEGKRGGKWHASTVRYLIQRQAA
jgi:hypothetical protein